MSGSISVPRNSKVWKERKTMPIPGYTFEDPNEPKPSSCSCGGNCSRGKEVQAPVGEVRPEDAVHTITTVVKWAKCTACGQSGVVCCSERCSGEQDKPGMSGWSVEPYCIKCCEHKWS